MTTAWTHLPNAAHIDRVLAHLKQHPDRWSAARGAAWDAARGAAWDAARGAAWDAARDAARDAIAALVAWDDCAYLLDQTPDFLRGCINLVGDHKAVLLLPAAIAMKECE